MKEQQKSIIKKEDEILHGIIMDEKFKQDMKKLQTGYQRIENQNGAWIHTAKRIQNSGKNNQQIDN